MPRLNKTYEVKADIQVVNESLHQAAKEMQGENIKTENNRLSFFMPSIWGWGGMDIDVETIESGGLTKINIGGYIGQLATGPLKKTLEELATKATSILKNKLGNELILTAGTNNITSYNDRDKKMVIGVTVGVVILGIIEGLRGKSLSVLLILPVLYLGYTFGKKLLYKNRP